ncbi:uncharacterized protein BDCG_04120 [Blastomyces dermatitidis ER-3]|uniref:Uncharacterized protein n=3 Tax=Blastomyces TaxID=229219 RepID=A0A179U9R8_BLAGS|nr:uncharacterized protein BDBG_01115 [Blastomyces gilchristii SLH14081]XP_045276018.1 uncharacterized protein BDCG_04120 [Blastomyces dermatitidis ER-3]EGE83235.2 hypothetical protein BDDG_06179 [Blastomyces dermatitidis ATCC 18188]EQL29156.1 hypothetical protein BDFG_08170 [Blastomyces dermatitidis ATCC 26199]EEQ89000.2 hypothetical protein BDCG_04120 [Blastomyces dermatitidis ER-3]OAT04590.1 hypothetical protein BDBG_01115 [Blastomyces gilchristii SLH14081]
MMADRSVDALQCFTFISENVPVWVTRITDLAVHTKAKHAEFTAEYARLAASGEAATKPRRRKNSSEHSIQPDDMHPSIKGAGGSNKGSQKDSKKADEHEEAVEEINEDYMDPITLLRMSKHYPNDLNQRKRNIATSKSAGTDRIVRPRQLVVVHYDSETQLTLEKLVRDIGGARNNIRKGRMSQMMKSGFGLKFLDHAKRKSTTRGPGEGARNPLDTLDPPSKLGKPVIKETGFDLVDKQLELAQSLCESAAHQFLRCGDCVLELEKAKERFATVLELAMVEVERLEKEAEAEKGQAAKATAEALMVGEGEEEEVERLAPAPTLNGDEKRAPDGLVAAIEVDDGSSISSISIDITAFRSSRFRA